MMGARTPAEDHIAERSLSHGSFQALATWTG